MTNSASGKTTRSVNLQGRALTAVAAVALLAVTASAGCSDSDGGAFDEYTGTWTIDPDPAKAIFTLTCPFLTDPLPFQLWSLVRLEEGTLSDLIDLGGPCPVYYDVSGKTATLASPDPFTKMAPICRIDESSDTVAAFLELQYANWKLSLLAPVKGEAPKAQLIGTANAPFFTVDADGIPQPDPAGDCSYNVHADLTKVGQN